MEGEKEGGERKGEERKEGTEGGRKKRTHGYLD